MQINLKQSVYTYWKWNQRTRNSDTPRDPQNTPQISNNMSIDELYFQGYPIFEQFKYPRRYIWFETNRIIWFSLKLFEELRLGKNTRKVVISCIVINLDKRSKIRSTLKEWNVDYLQHEMNPLDTQSLHILHQRWQRPWKRQQRYHRHRFFRDQDASI